MINVDKDGEPLRPAMIWLKSYTAAAERQLALAWSLVTQLREMSTGQLPLVKDSGTVEIWTNYMVKEVS